MFTFDIFIAPLCTYIVDELSNIKQWAVYPNANYYYSLIVKNVDSNFTKLKYGPNC